MHCLLQVSRPLVAMSRVKPTRWGWLLPLEPQATVVDAAPGPVEAGAAVADSDLPPAVAAAVCPTIPTKPAPTGRRGGKRGKNT